MFIYVISVLFSFMGKNVKHEIFCINYIYLEGESMVFSGPKDRINECTVKKGLVQTPLPLRET